MSELQEKTGSITDKGFEATYEDIHTGPQWNASISITADLKLTVILTNTKNSSQTLFNNGKVGVCVNGKILSTGEDGDLVAPLKTWYFQGTSTEARSMPLCDGVKLDDFPDHLYLYCSYCNDKFYGDISFEDKRTKCSTTRPGAPKIISSTGTTITVGEIGRAHV